jgi:hypothetical protein
MSQFLGTGAIGDIGGEHNGGIDHTDVELKSFRAAERPT